jgi:hypothetical protein
MAFFKVKLLEILKLFSDPSRAQGWGVVAVLSNVIIWGCFFPSLFLYKQPSPLYKENGRKVG